MPVYNGATVRGGEGGDGGGKNRIIHHDNFNLLYFNLNKTFNHCLPWWRDLIY